MTSIREAIRRRFIPIEPLTPGTYHYQAPPSEEFPYRFHLRIEPDGNGILIVNASTVLHLNQSATEYAYHMIKGTSEDQVAKEISSRYQVKSKQALQDYQALTSRIYALIDIPDLDPITYFGFDRESPYSGEISAPYRIDCALTYRLRPGADPDLAPTKRVDRELNTEEWYKIIEKSWNAGIPHIIFTGGEPTLRHDLIDIISFAESLGQVTGLLTDGFILADKDYLNDLLQTGLDHLMVILQPDFEETWKALERVLPEDLFTTVHITIDRDNNADIQGYLRKLEAMGVNSISLSSRNPESNDHLQLAREHAAELNVSLVWDIPVPYSSSNPILLELDNEEILDGAGRAWIYVEPDGDVLPAQGINRVLGNLLSEQWEQIWERSKFNNNTPTE